MKETLNVSKDTCEKIGGKWSIHGCVVSAEKMKKKICGCGLSVTNTLHYLDILKGQIRGLEGLVRENVDVENEYLDTLSSLSAAEQYLDDMKYFCRVNTDKIQNELREIENELDKGINQKDARLLRSLPLDIWRLETDIVHLLRECLHE